MMMYGDGDGIVLSWQFEIRVIDFSQYKTGKRGRDHPEGVHNPINELNWTPSGAGPYLFCTSLREKSVGERTIDLL